MKNQPPLSSDPFPPFSPNPEANPLWAWLGQTCLALCGWQATGTLPEFKRFVVIGAPHTSNWELPLAFAFMLALSIRINWMMKASLFFPPLGWFFKAVGGMPIDRSKRHNTVDQIVQAFDHHENFIIAITPEGTRSQVPYWKTGFYQIAYKAQVPIVMAYFDYKRKVIGLGPSMMPSGDLVADSQVFRNFYAQVSARYPEKVGPVQFSPESIARFQQKFDQGAGPS